MKTADTEYAFQFDMLHGEPFLCNVDDVFKDRTTPSRSPFCGLPIAPVRFYSMAEVIYLENDPDELLREYKSWESDVKDYIHAMTYRLISDSVCTLLIRSRLLKEINCLLK